MPNVEPSFVLYALLLEPGGCLRAHITLFELVEPEQKKKDAFDKVVFCLVTDVFRFMQGSASQMCTVPAKYGRFQGTRMCTTNCMELEI